MKILGWNVNCKVGSNYGRKDLLSLFQEKQVYDILILTEFYKLHDYECFLNNFKKWGYKTYISDIGEKNKRNDVFIAVSEKYHSKKLAEPANKKDMPDYLAVSLDLGVKEITVIGTRFWGIYQEMRHQFLNFIDYLNNHIKNDHVLISGDFNNGKIYGDENIIYTERQIHRLYGGYDHLDYNFHLIKLWFSQINFSLITPSEGFSHPYKPPLKGGSKIDHFATRGVEFCHAKYIETKLSDHNQLVGKMHI